MKELTHFITSSQWSLCIPPENITKPLVFYVLGDIQREQWYKMG